MIQKKRQQKLGLRLTRNTDSMNYMVHSTNKKISVYFPYYDVYTNIDTPMAKVRSEWLLKDPSRLKTWIDIPEQQYISPDYNGIGE